ncbi:hypothetical protein BRARA_I01252 [Brassica rapa]|uniref:Pentacotripeptide-repeat region of PRORP domain-containing protein n=1 Tax=Brassica campestris TaxID=3711 RepID=A0A397XT93_BRACM|nr:hypothetical protein BRARA_I01252 [Brassica rapa]
MLARVCRSKSSSPAVSAARLFCTRSIRHALAKESSVGESGGSRSGFHEIKGLDDAIDLFKDMVRSSPLPSAIDFNKLMGVVVRMERPDLVISLYQKMERKQIRRDIYSMNILIKCFCSCSKLPFALSTFGSVISIFIDGYCGAKRVDDGMELLHEMSRRGLVANTITYTTLIHGFCQEMISSGVCLNVVTCSTLLDGICDNGKLKDALEMFKVMQKSKMDLDASHPFNAVEPDVQTYNILICGLINNGNFLEAEELYEEMPHRGMVDDGVELFCEMGPRGIVANAITYITLIRGFGKVGNINGALDNFQEMISSGVIPDTITIRNMLTSLWSKEELKRAVAMLEDLQMSMLYYWSELKKHTFQKISGVKRCLGVFPFCSCLHGYCQARSSWWLQGWIQRE